MSAVPDSMAPEAEASVVWAKPSDMLSHAPLGEQRKAPNAHIREWLRAFSDYQHRKNSLYVIQARTERVASCRTDEKIKKIKKASGVSERG